MSALRDAARKAVSLTLVVLITVFLTEAFLVGLRRIPSLAALRPFTLLARHLYQKDRLVLPAFAECMRWDADLGYTLRPGRCVFANTEFSTPLAINSAGVRDAEEALRAPEVIVAGDSFAMGWGVASEDRYGERLARALGLRALNTGIASYGTVRELALLGRIDLSRVRLVVLQYCDNDFPENETFQRRGDRLETASLETWEARAHKHLRARRYWPGRYLFEMSGAALRRLARRGPAEGGTPDADTRANPGPDARRLQVETFCHVLEKSPVDLARVPVVVLELNPYNQNATWFIPMLAKELASGRRPLLAGRVFPVDVASRLGAADYFVLDDHLTPQGHRRVAELLLPACAAKIAPRPAEAASGAIP